MERGKAPSLKLFNLRVLPLFAAFLILGIFCVKLTAWVAVIVTIAAILFLFFLRKVRFVKTKLAVLLLIALAVGYVSAATTLYFRNEVGLSGEHTVACRVIEVTQNDDESYTVTADYLKRGNAYYVGKVSFTTTQAVNAGDRLSLKGKVVINRLSLDSFYTALSYRKGTKYAIDSPDVLSTKAGAAPLRQTIRTKVRSVLLKAEGERAGGFSYAMLFGDADFMNEADKSAMREVGVAHVIAVSGLHVGVLTGILLFLLRKLRVKDKVSVFILLPILGFYAYLANFTPSVLRAAIMGILAVAASALGERYDDASSLSFAAVLILLVKPLYLFDLSFVMSFLAIFGIQTLARPVERTLLRRKVNPRLASGIALSLSTTLALVPLSALVFGRVALAGLALNLVVVPLASLTFVLTVFAVLFTLAIPTFGVTLSVISYFPAAIMDLSAKTADLGLIAKHDFSAVELALYYATLLFVGKYCLAYRRVKLIVAGFGLAILTLLLFVA